MIPFLLKSALCMGILLLVYRLWLEREKMHRFNRAYLLAAIVVSLVVPLLEFDVAASAPEVLQNDYLAVITGNTATIQEETRPVANASLSRASAASFPWVWAGYTLVSLAFAARFVRNIRRLLADASAHASVPCEGARLVLLETTTASYSFLRYIFLSSQDYHAGTPAKEVITHELAHVRQKHSWDVIFIELLQCVLWLNPLLPLYKKAIQLNHEYLADEAVVNVYADVPAYQTLLLEKASRNGMASLASHFNYSVTKKRLVMLTLTNNPLRAACKQLAVLPVLAALVCFFSARNIVVAQTTGKTTDAVEVRKYQAPNVKVATPIAMNQKLLDKVPHTSGGLSQAELNEYIAAEQKLYDPPSSQHPYGDFEITLEQRYKLEDMFKRMSREQQMQRHMVFLPPLEPSKPEPPTAAQFERWKNPDVYGVWIGKKVANEELNKYQPSDFPWFTVSKLYGKAKEGKRYTHQVTLMTKKEFDEMNERRRKDKHYMLAFFTSSKYAVDSISYKKK